MTTNKMRRNDRELSAEQAKEILQNGKFGVMSVMGEDGYPYGIPLHYVMIGDSLYFHSTVEGGYKAACLEQNPKISFTVIETDDGIKCKSAIFFGTATCLPEMREIVLENFIEKFVPEIAWEKAKSGIPHAKDAVSVYKLTVERLTAKFVEKSVGK